MVFAPRFSTKRQEITYMVLRPTGASIYLKNLDTGREELLGRFPDMTMTMAPRFSPDDSKVAFAAAPALADITVDVNQAAVQPLPIAIPAFAGSPVGA